MNADDRKIFNKVVELLNKHGYSKKTSVRSNADSYQITPELSITYYLNGSIWVYVDNELVMVRPPMQINEISTKLEELREAKGKEAIRKLLQMA